MANQSEQTTVVSFPTTVDSENKTTTSPQPERLKKLRNSQVKLTQIQKDLEILIDAMAQNPSILSRASTYWGTIPLWQKIVAGIALIAPSLILGIFVQMIVCFVITAFTLAAYVGASVVLDDHFTHTQHSTKNIKSGVTSLAEGLEVVMLSLEQISDALSEQVTLFTKENEQFGENISELKSRNESLTQQVEKLQETEKKLRLAQAELETTCSSLKKSVSEQTTLLEESQAALNKIKIDYAQNQKELQEKTTELTEVQKRFTSEVAKYKKLLETLQSAIEIMAETATKDVGQQEIFHQKLTAFIENKDASFLDICDRICTAERELVTLKDLLEEEANKYLELIKKTEGQLNRLEHIQADQSSSLLGIHGIYAQPSISKPLEEASKQLTLQ